MNLYQLLENNKYKLFSQVNVGQENNPWRIVVLENGEIELVANNHIFFIWILIITLMKILK